MHISWTKGYIALPQNFPIFITKIPLWWFTPSIATISWVLQQILDTTYKNIYYCNNSKFQKKCSYKKWLNNTFFIRIVLQQKSRTTTTKNLVFATIKKCVSNKYFDSFTTKIPIQTKIINNYNNKNMCLWHFEKHVKNIQENTQNLKQTFSKPCNICCVILQHNSYVYYDLEKSKKHRKIHTCLICLFLIKSSNLVSISFAHLCSFQKKNVQGGMYVYLYHKQLIFQLRNWFHHNSQFV